MALALYFIALLLFVGVGWLLYRKARELSQ
jgi:hypothetical protein